MSEPHHCPHCDRVFQWGDDDDSHFGVIGGGETCGANAYWKLTGHLKVDHRDQRGHRCGRRETFTGDVDPGSDFWHKRDGYRACSYCGSMHPDDLFAAIKAGGCEIGGTDKNYKIYVTVGTTHLKFYYQHFDVYQQDEFIALYNARKLPLEPKFGLYVLPYFAHREEKAPV